MEVKVVNLEKTNFYIANMFSYRTMNENNFRRRKKIKKNKNPRGVGGGFCLTKQLSKI